MDNPYRTPFSGGSGLVGHGENQLKPGHVFAASIILYSIGAGIGIFLDLSLNDPIHFIFILGLLGVGASFFYTAPPFKFVYRGLGELAIATTFGPFVTMGSYYVQTVRFSWDPLLASLPVGALIMGILYVNEFPDHFADKRADKKHWIVQLGLKRAIRGYYAIIAFTYISIFFTIALGILPVFDFIDGMPVAGVLTLLAVSTVNKTVKILQTKYDKPMELIPASAGQIQVFTLIGVIICIAYGTRLLEAVI